MARFALIADFDPNGVATIVDAVQCWTQSKQHEIEVINFRGHKRGVQFPKDFSSSRYDGIIFHNTISYDPENLWSLGRSFPGGLASFSGRKILLKQDEHYKSALTDAAIVAFGFHLVFTLTSETNRNKFYPKSIASGVQFVEWLTGYVSERMRFWPRKPICERKVDLVYRGSMQPESFGRIANEKYLIALSAENGLRGGNLEFDISARWEDRLFGDSWYEFLASSRAVLGVESGASILDRHGYTWLLAAAIRRLLPNDKFRETRMNLLRPFESPGIYSAIAPRHFEAIALGTVQFMYPGDYSKVIFPGEHFFEIPKLETNWGDVADAIQNTELLQRCSDRAHKDIIASNKFSYNTFMDSANSIIWT